MSNSLQKAQRNIMDITKFTKLLEDKTKTKQDLMSMREKAISNNAIDHIKIAEHVLDQRFPNWAIVKSRIKGAVPTVAMFLGKNKHFNSQKDAYIWLIQHFYEKHPAVFETENWEEQYLSNGKYTKYFSKSLNELFNSSDSAPGPSNYHRFANGWYAKLVLSETQKIDLLIKFSVLAKLEIGKDWDWNSGRNSPGISNEELFRQLDELIDSRQDV